MYVLLIPVLFVKSLTEDMLLIFEREEGREREKHQCEREAPIGCLLDVPLLRIEPTTQVCALTKDETTLQPTEPLARALMPIVKYSCWCYPFFRYYIFLSTDTSFEVFGIFCFCPHAFFSSRLDIQSIRMTTFFNFVDCRFFHHRCFWVC